MSQKTKIGIIGCGNISPVYFQAARRMQALELVGCADMFFDRAQARAAEYSTQAFTVDDLIAHPEIQIIINLTIPAVHGTVGLRVIETGKSVYNEKPLALTRVEAQTMLKASKKRKVRVGGAPDTFLGAGLQTCRQLIDAGMIGKPVAASAYMLSGGPEAWHPDPVIFYSVGGGPMFDMGPYYITALTALLGPVRRVTGSAGMTYTEREVGSGPKQGQKIQVQIPTHIAGVLDFESGVTGTLVTSFDIPGYERDITIYGTGGTLICPDPNTFGGPVKLRRASEKEFTDIALTHSYADQSRGLGVADMAMALRSGRAHRASGELTYHTLDIMHAIHDASSTGKHVKMKSTMTRPAPLSTGLADGEMDV